MIGIALANAVAAAALVGGYRYWALRRNWLDQPNERSSHRVVVPRGAGIVFALLITAAALFHSRDQMLIAASFLPAFAVALIGWRDDLRGLTAGHRLTLYGLSAAGIGIAIYAPLTARALAQPALLVAMLILVLALTWLINLYNFMDGINGIAGMEALFVLGAALWLGTDSPFIAQLGPFLWTALGAVAGFLVWNFPVARVFMGDAGSAYLGALIGLLMLWSTQLGGPSLYSWLILLGVFVTDTGYTLGVRAITRQRWHLAHRLHAYQLLSDRLGNHGRTVLLLSLINVLWLLPCAWLARAGGWVGLMALAIAYAPLIATCYHLRAGIQQRINV